MSKGNKFLWSMLVLVLIYATFGTALLSMDRETAQGWFGGGALTLVLTGMMLPILIDSLED